MYLGKSDCTLTVFSRHLLLASDVDEIPNLTNFGQIKYALPVIPLEISLKREYHIVLSKHLRLFKSDFE